MTVIPEYDSNSYYYSVLASDRNAVSNFPLSSTDNVRMVMVITQTLAFSETQVGDILFLVSIQIEPGVFITASKTGGNYLTISNSVKPLEFSRLRIVLNPYVDDYYIGWYGSPKKVLIFYNSEE